ncbi:MAG: alpha/beta fold hydrolase [Nitrospinota bacterium]
MPTVAVNGVKLNYLVRGKGPPIVLSHGLQNSVFAFTPILDPLAQRFRVFALDKRGHGDSQKPPGPYRIQDFADDLLGFLDALGLERVDFLGHSMGGRTGTLFAAGHSDRLSRLMLVSSSAGPPSGAYRKHFEVLQRVAAEEGMEAVFNHNEFRRLIPPKMLEGPPGQEYRKRFLKNTPETYAASANALFTMPDLTGRLGEISVPTWVCYGENDPGPLDFSDIYLERIPNCTRVILPGSGHFPIWDSTGAFLAALEDFLARFPIPQPPLGASEQKSPGRP